MSDSIALAIKPIVRYPRVAQVGKTYLMTIDLEVDDGAEWQYEEEEYPVYCTVDSELFKTQIVGEPVIVLHRFGGSYGEAKYLLTSGVKPQNGKIRIVLTNRYGVSFKALNIEDIILQENILHQPDVVSDIKIDHKIYPHVDLAPQWAISQKNLMPRNRALLQSISRELETQVAEEFNTNFSKDPLEFLIEVFQKSSDTQEDVNQILVQDKKVESLWERDF